MKLKKIIKMIFDNHKWSDDYKSIDNMKNLKSFKCNVYSIDDPKEFSKKFKHVHFVFKYRIFLPALFLLDKFFGKMKIKKIPDVKHNKIIKIFDESVEKTNREWTRYLLHEGAYNDCTYEELNKIVDSALENIINANATYYILIQIAQDTPYDMEVILKLKSFDYQDFMTEYSLNSDIFKEVEGYLKNGDITGTFIRIYTNFIKIKRLLLSIKYEVSLNKMPTLSKIWEVNEEASRTLTFGQYITRIFYAL